MQMKNFQKNYLLCAEEFRKNNLCSRPDPNSGNAGIGDDGITGHDDIADSEDDDDDEEDNSGYIPRMPTPSPTRHPTGTAPTVRPR
eukprot:CAMPEP_0178731204 /NCGR_PEP_ID=MMETSP0699-20121125/29918_1 /TAXON_ID=265572 /ORGANISM="Extubocellulus spinifer, Strain CCMP396" /LENGTH=85 /DNA_ID=CAMNT_0020383261 /DNA_START=1770 /DNA_END=2030 /DNA_ORIENTATION=+